MTLAVMVQTYPSFLLPSITFPLLWLCTMAGAAIMATLLLDGWMKRLAVTFSLVCCVVIAGAILPAVLYDCSYCWWCLECLFA